MASGVISEATFSAAERAANLIQAELQNFPFEGEGKGEHFRDNVNVSLDATLTKLEIVASSDVPHAIILEEGAGPHVITPSNRRALMWNAGGGLIEASRSLVEGGKVFAASVQHPGVRNPPQPIAKTAAKLEPEIATIFNEAISSAIGRAGVSLKGGLPTSIAAGIRVGRVRLRGGKSIVRLRGAHGRFVKGIF